MSDTDPQGNRDIRLGMVRITPDFSVGDVAMFIGLLAGGLLAWNNLQHDVHQKANAEDLYVLTARVDIHEEKFEFLRQQLQAVENRTLHDMEDIRLTLRRIEEKLDTKADR